MMSSWQPVAMATATLLLLLGAQFASAQFKTAGIKTHQPPSDSLLLMGNVTTGQAQYNTSSGYSGNSSFTAAEIYQGAGQQSGGAPLYGHYVQPVNVHATRGPTPRILDATAEFINKTRSAMASGICYKEVPTLSLIRDTRVKIAGNGTSPDMSRIQVCCEGYERNPHIYRRCEPICADDCPNGICTAPNTCVCIPGHVRNNEGKCISTCPLGCGNGVCDDANECRCRPGYTLDPISHKYCQPTCSPACANGQCVAPNTCACLDGYQLAADGSCKPKCDHCENGQCTTPGYCSCNEGYLKVEGRCEPICTKGCQNGRCIAPDTCECTSGNDYDKGTAQCVPHCDLPCLNGVCQAYNTCSCNPGYVLDEHQRNICQPHCSQGCPNGFCSGPNFCICKPGYIKSGIKGRQSCVAV